MTKIDAMKLWEYEFGDAIYGYDFDKKKVFKGAYNQRGSRYGWNIDHILPKSYGGTDDISNLQITHISTNEKRSNKTIFWCNGTKYAVKRTDNLDKNDKITFYPYLFNDEEYDKEYCIVVIGDLR